jgi:hypothetical protein
VKEYHDGTPWLVLEPQHAHLPILQRGFLGLDLAPGTSIEAAHALADKLDEMITDVTYTE